MPPETEVKVISTSDWDSLVRQHRETEIELFNLRDDVRRTGQLLLEEAERREWCEEFDNFIEELPLRIVALFPKRPRQHLVTIDYHVYVTFNVNAVGQDDAIALGRDVYNSLKEHEFFEIPRITEHDVTDTDISWDLYEITAERS